LTLKKKVRSYWNKYPCGTKNIGGKVSKKFFDTIDKRRYKLEPFIEHFAEFKKWKGRKILEMGCGNGSDLMQFDKNKAIAYGIDFSKKSIKLAKERIKLFDTKFGLIVGDVENLPFRNNIFDFVYCWGVLHHTPNYQKSVREIYRVLKAGGKFCVMVYHKRSMVCLQLFLRYKLFEPSKNLDEIIALHHESPGTKFFTKNDIIKLFSMFKKLKIQTIVTLYDLRIAKRKYLTFLKYLIPSSLGFFMTIRGEKNL